MNKEKKLSKELIRHLNEITEEYQHHHKWTSKEYLANEQIRQLVESSAQEDTELFEIKAQEYERGLKDAIKEPSEAEFEEFVKEKACEASRFYSVNCKTVADSRNFICNLFKEYRELPRRG